MGKRFALPALTAGLTVSLVVTGLAGAPAARAATACRVTYTVASQWPGGFVANATVTNLGDALNGWTLTWNFTAGETVSTAWGASVAQSGAAATATNAAWNGAVPVNGTASFGFQGVSTPTAGTPTGFAINGTACTGTAPVTTTTSGGTTSTTSTTSATTTRPTTTTTTTQATTTSTTTTRPTTTTTTTTTTRPTTTTTTTRPTTTTTTSAVRNTFTNPIKANGADPALTYYNGYYYLSTTTWSTYMSMRRARTVAGLATATDQTIWTADNANRGYNMWAPDFQRLTGPNGTRWYYMFSAGRQADLNLQHLVVLESSGDDPMGPYHFAGEPLGTAWGIDGNYLQYNGSLYLLYSAWSGAYQNIYVRRMTNPWTVTGSATLVTSPTLSWEQVGGNTDEGPAVIQHGGRTFVSFSASSCNTPDYKLGLVELVGDPMVASNWRKSPNPIFTRNDANGVYGPGHNYFFTSPDGTENWMAYHANASSSQGCGSTRSTRVQKVTWNTDGTPNLGVPVRTGTTLTAPAGEPVG